VLSVALVLIPGAYEREMVHQISSLCDGMMLFPTSEETIRLTWDTVARSLFAMEDFCLVSDGYVDDSYLKELLREPGQLAIIEAEASGPDRSDQIMSLALPQLTNFLIQENRIDRVLMQYTSCKTHPALMREHRRVYQQLIAQIGTIPNTVKISLVKDMRQDDRLRVTLLVGTPVE
jgi:hypothetical protein